MLNPTNEFTPFLVADRPASLRIISGLNSSKFKGKIGIMCHSNTTSNFKELMSRYPCIDATFCDATGAPCNFSMKIDQCAAGLALRKRTIRISDSGVFTREGCTYDTYESLFSEYEKMRVDYGVMIDYLKDYVKTIDSARQAMEEYRRKTRSFNLIGVAQGSSLEEYSECYRNLQGMGYAHIAVGGLLHKIKNTVRFTKVENEGFMFKVLQSIRDYDPNGWLFALGCYSRARQPRFAKLRVFGSDYKGWIFHYSKKFKKEKRAREDRYRQIRKFLEDCLFGERRLLIVSCSKRKLDTDIPTTAIQLYDGPQYRLLRKFFANPSTQDNLDIFIISAKHGLISAQKRIRPYDLKMSPKRAMSLNEKVLERLLDVLSAKRYSQACINLGKSYLTAIDGLERLINNNSPVTQVISLQGKIGERMRSLKEWIMLETYESRRCTLSSHDQSSEQRTNRLS